MLLRGYNNGQVDDRGISYWIQAGGDATLKSYGQQGIPESDLQWMANLPLYIDLGDYWLVHAGIDPYLDLNEQTSEQFCWIREKFFKADFAYFNNKTIVTGHTITFTFPGVSSGEIAVGNGWIDIETGAYHKKSGWLTALDIDNNLVYQVNVFSKKQRKKSLDKISKSIDALKVK
jgi:serine/threonine protein phosphatase 1